MSAPVGAVEPFTHSGHPLRQSLIIRPPTSAARFPLSICRADLYDIPAGTALTINAWGNFTNDSGINHVGLSCEIHLCDPICPVYDGTRRFDRIGGYATTGGANVSWKRHHEVVNRYGRIEVRQHHARLAVELQCKAYNGNVRGNKERLTVDWCGIDVEAR